MAEKEDMSDNEESLAKDVSDMRMSRTEEPEYGVEFEKIRDKIVFDGMGNQIKFGDIYKSQKTIIVFIRHFLDFVTKDYVEDLGMIPLEYLQESDVRLVVIGPAPFKFINDFRHDTKFNYTLYCDPERELYEALELTTGYEHVDGRRSKHIKQNAFMGVLRNMWKIMKSQEWHGDTKQNGGVFILGPGEVTHYHHREKHQVDQVPINEILQKAGVQPVSFPKDPRVLEL